MTGPEPPPNGPLLPGWSKQSRLELQRLGTRLHVQYHGFNNHELREVLCGLWLSLDEDDRADHIRALQHYSTPEGRPSGVALQIARAMRAGQRKRS